MNRSLGELLDERLKNLRRRGNVLLPGDHRDLACEGALFELSQTRFLGGDAEDVGALLLRHHHAYPDLEVELAFYAARLPPGAAPRALGVAELAWAPAADLGAYDFLEADRAVLGELARLSAAAG